jgi:hypothetical protein
MSNNQFFFIFLAIVILIIVVDLMRRSVLREKYAVVWFATSIIFLVFAIWPETAVDLSDALGFETPSNFVLGLVIFLLLTVVMQLSLEVGKLEDKVQTLADESALMKNQNKSK